VLRRCVLDGSRRVLHRSGGVLNGRGRVLHRLLHGRGRVLGWRRRVSLRLLDHRCARAAMADGSGVRRRARVATDRGPSTGTALNDRALSTRSSRAVPGRDAAATGGSAATAERGTFLTEDAAVDSATGVGAHGATGAWTAGLAAQPDSAAGVTAQTGAARNSRRRRLRRRMPAECGAAAQVGSAAFATDAQSGTAGSLTADPDATERAGHVRSGSTIQRGAFASDQPRLTARTRTECGISAHTGTGEAAAGTESALAGQRGPRTQTGLAAQTCLAASTEPPDRLATKAAAGLAGETGLVGETALAGETGLADTGNADSAIQGSPAAEPGIHPGLLTHSGSGSASDPATGTCTEAATDTALTTQIRTAVKAGATAKTGFTAQPGFATHTNTGAIAKTETGLGAQTGLSPETKSGLATKAETSLGTQASTPAKANAQSGVDLDAQADLASETAAGAELTPARLEARPGSTPTRAALTGTRATTGAEVTPTRPMTVPARPMIAPTGPVPVPAWSPLTGARPECPPTGLPAVSRESTADSAVKPGVNRAEDSACPVGHQGGAVFRHRSDRIGRIASVALVVTPIAGVIPAVTRVVAPIAGVVAVLVGQNLLQTTDRVARTEVHARHRTGHRGREHVRRHVHQAGVGHGLAGAGDERLRGARIGKQVQDVLDQFVHDRFPPKFPECLAPFWPAS
jgi:hypothetical protein